MSQQRLKFYKINSYTLLFITNLELRSLYLKKMKILYVRVSTIEQNTDRQKVNETNFNLVLEDKCSGAIPFFQRPMGEEIKNHTEKGIVSELHVFSIDRLGRDLRDIINTIYFFSERKIPILFINQGLRTLDESGEENSIAKMVIGMLATLSEMQRKQIKENQKQGILIAKARGVYKGRKPKSKEGVVKFLSKKKNRTVMEYLKRGLKFKEAAKLANVSINTVTKIKKMSALS